MHCTFPKSAGCAVFPVISLAVNLVPQSNTLTTHTHLPPRIQILVSSFMSRFNDILMPMMIATKTMNTVTRYDTINPHGSGIS